MKHAGLAVTASILLGACGTTVAVGPTGSGGGTGGASSSTSSAEASTTSATTTTSTGATTSTSTGATTSTGTTTPAVCVPQCSADADCQSSCPAVPMGINCCDLETSICYESPSTTCPPPACIEGAACNPGSPSCMDIYGGSTCNCTCDTSGHYACTPTVPPPMCPAVHPTCGDPCSTPASTCTCSLGPGQGTTGCDCGSSGTWECSASGACPPFQSVGYDYAEGCADFPVGLACPLPAPAWACTCQARCGTQIWSCQGI